jgi:hypothetical protein
MTGNFPPEIPYRMGKVFTCKYLQPAMLSLVEMLGKARLFAI